MNILLTCAGRRNYLIKYWQEAVGSNGRVYAVDSDPTAPALHEASQGFVLPPFDSANYIAELLKVCRDNSISLVVPLNDLELPVLAQHKEEFTAIGITLLVSSKEVIDICFDKWRTVEFCCKIGINFPATFLTLEEAKNGLENKAVSFPLVVKPRWGSASIGIEYVYDLEELEITYRLVKKRILKTILGKISSLDPDKSILIQEMMAGEEFGIDVVNDLNSRFRAVFIRRKIAMRAGETDKAETVDDPALTEVGRRIGENLRHIGNLDCDLFVTNSGIWLLEMNPRFGGSYPFSHLAGANLPAAIVAWARGEEAKPEWLKQKLGVISAKCDRLVEVSRGKG